MRTVPAPGKTLAARAALAGRAARTAAGPGRAGRARPPGPHRVVRAAAGAPLGRLQPVADYPAAARRRTAARESAGPARRWPAATAAHLQAIETAAKTYHDELRQQVAAQQPCRTDHRPHLGRDMEDQPAQAALAANLLCPHYVRIVCGTLDRLPQAFAELDRQAIKASTPLQRNNKDAQLRKRIRAWAATDE